MIVAPLGQAVSRISSRYARRGWLPVFTAEPRRWRVTGAARPTLAQRGGSVNTLVSGVADRLAVARARRVIQQRGVFTDVILGRGQRSQQARCAVSTCCAGWWRGRL